MKISLLLVLAVLSIVSVFWLGFRGIETASREVAVLTELNIPLTDALSKVAFNSAEQWCHVERAIRYGLDMAQDNRHLSSEIAERNRIEEQLRESEQAAVQLAQRAEAARLDVKQLNQELQDVNAGLEEAVHERTRELEGFSYSVSHDLRAPLRAVNGFSQMLQKDYGKTLDAEGKRLLEIVRTNVQRMGTLIDDLLSFSRLGRKAMHAGHVNMTELATDVYAELKSAVPERQVNLNIRNVAPAWGDRNLIQQVFVNLISNAIKFTGGRDIGEIDIWSETKDDMNVYCVKDNGAGFDMEYADKLFGVFQRLHSDEEFEGTGIGLALVHRIIKRHDGSIWAQSEPDKGATFYFTLPHPGQDNDSEQHCDVEQEEVLVASTGDQNNEA
ncbi:MAG: two-component sensor histidine kinase [Phycisphaeraceae bacterium]|nr:two-component sensor histidine kinase [Phycisphaeraceae bacterium]